MEEFTHDLFTCRYRAVKAARLATRHLIGLLQDEEADLATAIAEAAEWRAYARWWTSLTDHVEHGRTDPATALANARTSAHDTLLDLPAPRHECPYANAQAITAIEAARRFFHDTATLHPDTVPTGTTLDSTPQPAPDPDTARPQARPAPAPYEHRQTHHHRARAVARVQAR